MNILSKKDEHIESMIEMCLSSLNPKEEIKKLFDTTFENWWEMCCHYRSQTRRITVYQTLGFMSSYLDVEDEDAEIERLANDFFTKNGKA